MLSKYSSAPLVVVIGATGQQGGSVVRALIASEKEYRIRAIVRDQGKPAAQELVAKGVQLFTGDLSVPGDVESALWGAHVLFGVTDFWAHRDKEREIKEGKGIVDAAKAANVKLFCWSGCESPSALSGGKLTTVDHCESKAAVTAHAKECGVPIVVILPGVYANNFATVNAPVKQDDGSYAILLPIPATTRIPVLDTAHDFGTYVRVAIESPSFGAGTEVLAASEFISYEDIAKQLAEASGQTVVVKEVPEDAFIAQAGAELTAMLHYFHDYGFYGGKDIAPSQASLAAPVHKFADYVNETDWSKILF